MTRQNSKKKSFVSVFEKKITREFVFLQQQFNLFVKSLSELLIDINALEINTVIVEKITGDKFIPRQVYCDIYPISPDYLETKQIHYSLRDRYLNLRQSLELEYNLLLSDPNSDFYNPTIINNQSYIVNNSELGQQNLVSYLPNPINSIDSHDFLTIQKLLHNSRFLRSLRRIAEFKTVLDSRNQQLINQPEINPEEVKSDLIYAQTVIQLDGNIINRYSQEIFTHPQKDLILKIHKESVAAGEKQWRGLLGFILEIIQKIMKD